MASTKVQIGKEQPREVNTLRFEGGDGITLTEVRGTGDTAEVAINIAADIGDIGTIDALEVTVDSTNLDGTGTDLQTVLEELEDQIDAAAISAAGIAGAGGLVSAYVEFEETAGAGTYTGGITLPDNVQIHHVWFETTAAWDADTAVLDIGYTGLGAAFVNDHDVIAGGVEADTLYGLGAADDPAYLLTSDEDFLTTMTTTGAGGTTGRTRVGLLYSVPVVGTTPSKA